MKSSFKNKYSSRNLRYGRKKESPKNTYGQAFLTRLCVCALLCAIIFAFSKIDSPKVRDAVSSLKYAITENIDFGEARQTFSSLYDKALKKGGELYDSYSEELTGSEI